MLWVNVVYGCTDTVCQHMYVNMYYVPTLHIHVFVLLIHVRKYTRVSLAPPVFVDTRDVPCPVPE